MLIDGIEYKTREVKGKVAFIYTKEFYNKICSIRKESSKYSIIDIKDEGTCCLDSGIYIKIVYPRERTVRNFILVESRYQGNISSLKSLLPVLEFLNTKYPELNAYYEEGRMD
jgi:hypothetical protein